MATAGSFSGHLLQAYEMNSQTPRGPFGQPLHIATHGPMAFAPQMHGNLYSMSTPSTQNTSFFSDSSFSDVSEDTARKIAELQVKLNRKLGPEYVSQRPGPGGGPKLTYVEGWKIINLANEVFGFNGWSSNVVSVTVDFIDCDEQSKRYSVGVTAIVRVTLRDGVFHEDLGYGLLENTKSKGAALDKCKKEAITDAIKRTLRNFGNLLGNCVYDKSYTQEVNKIKVPPPKFDRSELHRRPEFEEAKPPVYIVPQGPAAGPSSASTSYASSSDVPSRPMVKFEPDVALMPPPPHIPQHMSSVPSRPNATSTPNFKGTVPTGLSTPVQTPTGPPGQRRPAPGPSNAGGMSERNAERHAARLKIIQEAQEAQRREEEAARTAAAAAPHIASRVPASSAAETVPQPQQPHTTTPSGNTEDGDDFHFPSDDDAFFANLDMDALDDGVGRPINFEEDASTAMDTDGDGHASSSGSSAAVEESGGYHQQPGHPQGVSSRPPTSHQNQNRPPTTYTRQAGPSSTAERPRTPSMGGGFNFPAAAKSGQPQPRSGSASSSSGLKRTADIMQGINAGLAQARRPQQGMGLQNPASATGGAQSSARREPFAALEVSEGGDVKRPRRA